MVCPWTLTCELASLLANESGMDRCTQIEAETQSVMTTSHVHRQLDGGENEWMIGR